MKFGMVSLGVAFGFALAINCSAQNHLPYLHSVTDRKIRLKTPMLPPPVNSPFIDPDFGSRMVRATDETTNFILPGTYLTNESSGQQTEWSTDSSKFYVMGEGGQVLALGFDASTMAISSLPYAKQGEALLVPLHQPTFSSADPDLIYGATDESLLTITSYRFSTGQSAQIVDTTQCGTQPPLRRGTGVYSDALTVSADDSRFALDEGGPRAGAEPLVVVYDQALGCRWYNTQTGEIGGQWGSSGQSPISGFLVDHAYLSKSGTYVRIMRYDTWYVWDLATLNVTACHDAYCAGYGAGGYDSYVNAPGVLDGFQIVKRPLDNLSDVAELNMPLTPHNWGQDIHFTWANANALDTSPVCASSYMPDSDGTITKVFEGEVFCIETDELSSTIWRFAHNRATTLEDGEGDYYFNTQPLGDVSPDGNFFLFTSDWDAQLGTQTDGTPRSDVWIVQLDWLGSFTGTQTQP
jgi:hypothetical protein